MKLAGKELGVKGLFITNPTLHDGLDEPYHLNPYLRLVNYITTLILQSVNCVNVSLISNIFKCFSSSPFYPRTLSNVFTFVLRLEGRRILTNPLCVPKLCPNCRGTTKIGGRLKIRRD